MFLFLSLETDLIAMPTVFSVSMYVVMLAAVLLAQLSKANDSDPLFESNELLELTLHAPVRRINKVRDSSLRYPSTLSYRAADGKTVNLDVNVKVRGKNRLRKNVCKFPPLRIIFDKAQTAGTIFQNQKKLKLVTQCDPVSRAYEHYLLNEFLAYRILNEITPRSFRVRLARISYRDIDSSKSRSNFGFFVEHKKRLAKRLGTKLLRIEQTSAADLDSSHLNQTSLFQLMIGNVDWSATSGDGSRECCHNYKLFEREGADILSIPYDFDLSGLVNAKYARPDIEMGLKTVRDRRYRGYCRNNDFLEDNIKLFNDKKSAIIDLYQGFRYLPERRKKSGISYIGGFYKIINAPKRIRRVILKRCHKSYMQEVPDT